MAVRFNGYLFNIHPSIHNFLEKIAIESFLPLFSNSFIVLYFSDTDNKSLHVTRQLNKFMSTKFDVHKKLPDIVAYDRRSKVIYFIEAVASSGEIDFLRKKEIEKIFESCPSSITKRFISIFKNRSVFRKFSDSLAMGTEAWVVEDSPHIVSFNNLE